MIENDEEFFEDFIKQCEDEHAQNEFDRWESRYD